jgi:hypothetical protein
VQTDKDFHVFPKETSNCAHDAFAAALFVDAAMPEQERRGEGEGGDKKRRRDKGFASSVGAAAKQSQTPQAAEQFVASSFSQSASSLRCLM